MDSVLAGLPEAKAFWSAQTVLRHLLLVGLLDGISGSYLSYVAARSEVFTLPRGGYACWYHLAMLRSSGVVCLSVGAVTLLVCFVSTDDLRDILTAGVILALNFILLNGIQLLLILLLKKAAAGYLAVMLIQLVSLCVSEQVPHPWKLALIGNWGMAVRSSLFTPDGYPIKTAIMLELVILIVLWCFGWRIIRRSRRYGLWT